MFMRAERVCSLLCGNEVDLILILLSFCENAFHLLRNTANYFNVNINVCFVVHQTTQKALHVAAAYHL
ncbi:hypothetical protein DNTS_029482, partial [Danionella cerebrum]